jgi:FlgN protein
MERDNEAILELLQQRLETLELLTRELLASQKAFAGIDLKAVLQHVTQQRELCDALCRLDQGLMSRTRGILTTQLGSEASSFSLAALVAQMDPDSAGRLRTILDQMEATRADLRRLNRTQGEFLRRSRRNTDVLLNLAMSCMGTYGPPKAARPRALLTWSGV